MEKRIVFTVYTESLETEEQEQVYSCVIITNWEMEEINRHLDFQDGFSSMMIEGCTLSFVDFTCLTVSPDAVIKRINTIPTTNVLPAADTTDKAIFESDEEINEEPLVRNQRDKSEFLYEQHRFECGASGYSEFILWASSHPLEMMAIGGAAWDTVKLVIRQGIRGIKKILGMRQASHGGEARNVPLRLSVKSLYKNFAKMSHMNRSDLQIIRISRAKKSVHNVTIRTVTGEQFSVQCRKNGKIISCKNITSLTKKLKTSIK